MKDFSNETKNKRRKAILKVILKRYSFIIWVPVLLILFNYIGIIFIKFAGPIGYSDGLIVDYITNIFFGIITTVLLMLLVFALLLMVEYIIEAFKGIIEYLKRGTIVEDFIYIIKLIKKILVEIFYFFISLPKKFFLRIKDEKRRFNNSLEKELRRNKND